MWPIFLGPGASVAAAWRFQRGSAWADYYHFAIKIPLLESSKQSMTSGFNLTLSVQ